MCSAKVSIQVHYPPLIQKHLGVRGIDLEVRGAAHQNTIENQELEKMSFYLKKIRLSNTPE